MKQGSFFSQWLILGIALLVFGGAIGLNIALDHARVQSREQERLLAQARVVQGNAISNLVAIRQVLVGLRKRLHRGLPEPDENERLKTLTDAAPGVRTLLLLDAAGKAIAADRPELLGRDFSHRNYFTVPRKFPDEDKLYISTPFRTVLGAYAVNVSMAVAGPDGKFGGVISATLDPVYFSNVMNSVLYAPDMRAWMLHGDGEVFMTAPTRTEVIGMSMDQPGTFFARHKTDGQDESLYMGAALPTGDDRLIALMTIKAPELNLDKPFVVTVSRDAGEVFAGWRRDLFKLAGLFGLIAALSILALYAFQRRQLETSRRLGEVDKALLATDAKIRESEENYRAIIETTGMGFAIVDASTRVIDANQEYVRLSGHAVVAEIVGRNPAEWIAAHDRERHAIEIKRCLELGHIRNLEIDYLDGQGEVIHVEINATVVHRGSSPQIVALCRDISERKRRQQQINQLAYYDALTDLPNRRLMLERLNQGLAQAKRFRRCLAVMFLDLDYFKDVNDSLGHDVGDELLKVVGERLKICVRDGDTVCRQGGDEFVIVLTEITRSEDAILVADKIINIMREPVVVREHTLHITTSIGIAVYSANDTDEGLQDLMKKADIAMYEAKKDGRNRFRLFE